MGTRGLWGMRKDGIDKLTYNHFDSYPAELGETVKDFLSKHSVKELENIFDKIILVSEETKPTDEQIKECHSFANVSVSTKNIQEWYCLLRNSQGKPEAYAKGLRYMIDSHDFIKDSLFCEWAYIINLDSKKLEIYEGFQKTPQNNRYKSKIRDNYANCKLIKEIPFEEIKQFEMQTLEN